MAEVAAEADHVPHHPKKIAFLFSAMRHLAAELRAEGVDGRLRHARRAGQRGLAARRAGAGGRAAPAGPGRRHRARRVAGAGRCAGLGGRSRPPGRDPRRPPLLLLAHRLRRLGARPPQVRMEPFYRAMRRKTGLLMDEDGAPVGGRWNYDADNRERLPEGASTAGPAPLRAGRDHARGARPGRPPLRRPFRRPRAVLVRGDPAGRARRRSPTSSSTPCRGSVPTRTRCARATPWLFHSALSPVPELRPAVPREVCAAAERAYRQGSAPLASVEGFIRQILGWREFVRGVYWLRMPGYARAQRAPGRAALPDFYWTGETDLNCLTQVIGADPARGLLAPHPAPDGDRQLRAARRDRPAEVEEWYLAVYADASNGSSCPTSLGMALYADGGYWPRSPTRPPAPISTGCPTTAGTAATRGREDRAGRLPVQLSLLELPVRNRAALGRNPRMAQAYRTLDELPEGRIAAILATPPGSSTR